MNDEKKILSHKITHYGPVKENIQQTESVLESVQNNEQTVIQNEVQTVPIPSTVTNEQNLNVQPVVESIPVDQKEKKSKKNKLLIPIIILMLVIIGAVVYFTFFFNKEESKIVSQTLNLIPLAFKTEEEFNVIDVEQNKHVGSRKFINDFGIDIDYQIVEQGYQFNVENNMIDIKTKDNKYQFKLIQLDNNPYEFISKNLENQYNNLIGKLKEQNGSEFDLNSLSEMQQFYKKNNIKKQFMTLSKEDKIKLINKNFNIDIKDLSVDLYNCNNNDCTNIIYTVQNNNTIEKIYLYTRSIMDDNEKEYFGTYLIYEKYDKDLRYTIDMTYDMHIKGKKN